jgi:transcription elongation factor GreB
MGRYSVFMDRPNYITPAGYTVLREEYEHLLAGERPKLVEVISWAAGNGDRSENGDYIYGRKRLREIDRRLGWLSKRMKAAKVVDPAAQEDARVVRGVRDGCGRGGCRTGADPGRR